MRILILSRNTTLHSIRRLLAEARKAGLKCEVIDPLDCQVVLEGKRTGVWVGARCLPRYDVVIPRIGASITEYGLGVVRQFEAMGVRVLNGAHSIAQSRDKMRCLQVLSSEGIRVPRTVLTRNSPGAVRNAVARMGGMPVVMKLLQGTQGLGVMLLQSELSLVSVMETLEGLNQDFLLQEFVSEGAGRDYRAFVIGGKVVTAMLRTAPEGEFRTNIHRGGEGTFVKLPKRYEQTAIKACKVLGLEIAGVDMMESKGGPLVLEVNSSPGFEGIERVTRLNVGAEVMKYVKRLS